MNVSFKYFIDIFEIYDDVSFIFIRYTKNDLNKIKKDRYINQLTTFLKMIMRILKEGYNQMINY